MKTTSANITKTLKKLNWQQSKECTTSIRGYHTDSTGFRTIKCGETVKVVYLTGKAINTDRDIEHIDFVLTMIQSELEKAGFSVTRNADSQFITVH